MIGMVMPIIKIRLYRTLWDQTQVNIEYCVAAHGPTMITMFVLRTENCMTHRVPTTSSVFVVPVNSLQLEKNIDRIEY